MNNSIDKTKVLHVMYQSIPNISGSSTRSFDIVSTQKKIGLEPIVITSPFQKGEKTMSGYEYIKGIQYYRTYSNNSREEVSENGNNIFTRIKKMMRVVGFYNKIKTVAKENNVHLIHSHAMFFCGLPSILVARKLKIPHVYEVRSLWEERKKDSNKGKLFVKIEHTILRSLETLTMKNSDAVIAINNNLRDNILNRGVKPEKLHVIQNAVNMDFIEQKKLETSDNQNLNVLGYIGSISPIEGLDDLVRVIQLMNTTRTHKLKLLIFGSGKNSEIEKLQKLIGNDNNIELKGSINRNEIHQAYNQVSVIVNPRKKSKLTDSVTPLKPLEAMGFEKIVIASNVGGMKELIEDNNTGFLFLADDLNDLEKTIEKVMSLDEKKLTELKFKALNYIQNERSWEANAEIYNSIYKELITQ